MKSGSALMFIGLPCPHHNLGVTEIICILNIHYSNHLKEPIKIKGMEEAN